MVWKPVMWKGKRIHIDFQNTKKAMESNKSMDKIERREPTNKEICMMCHWASRCRKCCSICRVTCNSKQYCQIGVDGQADRLEALMKIYNSEIIMELPAEYLTPL